MHVAFAHEPMWRLDDREVAGCDDADGLIASVGRSADIAPTAPTAPTALITQPQVLFDDVRRMPSV